VTLQFSVAANSFFPILVFNDPLSAAAEPGSMALIPQNVPALPTQLGASLKQLVVQKLPSNQGFDLAVRDSKTGFTFFNVEGGKYDYDANAQSLSIVGGRLLISKQFANTVGRPSDAGSIIGKISVGAAMQPIEIDRLNLASSSNNRRRLCHMRQGFTDRSREFPGSAETLLCLGDADSATRRPFTV
jgi:hypothetical protein